MVDEYIHKKDDEYNKATRILDSSIVLVCTNPIINSPIVTILGI